MVSTTLCPSLSTATVYGQPSERERFNSVKHTTTGHTKLESPLKKKIKYQNPPFTIFQTLINLRQLCGPLLAPFRETHLQPQWLHPSQDSNTGADVPSPGATPAPPGGAVPSAS